MTIRIQSEDFDISDETAQFRSKDGKVGAVVCFVGHVRGDDNLIALELEHYPDMAEKILDDLVQKARARWDVLNILIIHRIGRLEVGAQIMMVAVASAHRQAAFETADFLMDYLKSRAPFWKKEYFKKSTRWVSAKTSDEHALYKWQN